MKESGRLRYDFQRTNGSILLFVDGNSIEISTAGTLGVYAGPNVIIKRAEFNHITTNEDKDPEDADFYVEFNVNNEDYEVEGSWWQGEMRKIQYETPQGEQTETVLQW